MTQAITLPAGPVSVKPMEGERSIEDALNLYQSFNKAEIYCQFLRAEVCAYVDTRYGEGSVAQFLDLLRQNGTKLGKTQFYDLANVWRTFGTGRDERTGEITISAHAENLSLTHLIRCCRSSDPEGWADKARENEWTVLELENQLALAKLLPGEEKPATGPVLTKEVPISIEQKLYFNSEDIELLGNGTQLTGLKDANELVHRALEMAFGSAERHMIVIDVDDEYIDNMATIREYLHDADDQAVVRLALQRTAKAIEHGGGGREVEI